LGNRFTATDILKAIIKPSDEISDQYAATNFYLKDGTSVMGRLIKQDDSKYYVSQNPFAPNELTEIDKNKVVSTKLSKVSVMLPGMINRLNEDELKDLMAYLISGGNKDNKVFKSASK
jgi:putative heme-binding domain-containing protein